MKTSFAVSVLVALLFVQACLSAALLPLVFVHGASEGGAAFDTLRATPAISAGATYAVSLPGHPGNNASLPGSVTFQDYINTIQSAITTANSNSNGVILVGHSFGGLTSSAVAELNPSVVRAIIFIAAYVPRIGTPTSFNLLLNQDQGSLVHTTSINTTDYSYIPDASIFLNNCPISQTALDTASTLIRQTVEPAGPLGYLVNVTSANWGQIPKYYINTLQDQVVTPSLQSTLIPTIPNLVNVTGIQSGHAPFVCQVDQTASIISAFRANISSYSTTTTTTTSTTTATTTNSGGSSSSASTVSKLSVFCIFVCFTVLVQLL